MQPLGLIYKDDYITNEEQDKLLNFINANTWDNTLKRRVQHYGYKYIYRNARQSASSYIVDECPELFITLYKRIVTDYKLGGEHIDDISKLQIIVNEYTKGQSISPHIDDTKLFGNCVACISLGTGCIIDFNKLYYNRPRELAVDTFKHFAKKGSLYIMTGDSRFKWYHSLTNKDINTRISITFRIMNV